jgi:hypothetical protein
MRILDWKVKVLNRKCIILVKFQWICNSHEDDMWEHEDTMRE